MAWVGIPVARTMNYFGSDLILDAVAAMGIDYVALNPGATLRGLHDSLLRRSTPEIISTLHEEIAVGIAHGYAKASDRLMAVAIHDHVGPLHAHMAVFNAWADDVPILILGGSGPRRADMRRPWIDWIHTAFPSSAPLRDVLKWDAEPHHPSSLLPDLARAHRRAMSIPRGPVFVAIDALLQEAAIARPAGRMPTFTVPAPPVADPASIDELARKLVDAATPVIMVDRPPRGTMEPLVALAEAIGAAVVDLGARTSFPTTHWADQTQVSRMALEEADLVVLLDPRDVVWALTETDEQTRGVTPLVRSSAETVTIGTIATRNTVPIDRGAESLGSWHVEGSVPQALASVTLTVSEAPPAPGRVATRRETLRDRWQRARTAAEDEAAAVSDMVPIHPARLALAIRSALRGGPWMISNGRLGGWLRRLLDFEAEDAHLGRSGGEGLGYGMAASVGAALARRDDDVLVVDVQSDGDMLYTPQALWTAAHHRLPVLVIVYDNHAYGRDLAHQAIVARARGWDGAARPEGVSIVDPEVRFCELAASFGVESSGPVTEPDDLDPVLEQAVRTVRTERRPFLVHVVAR